MESAILSTYELKSREEWMEMKKGEVLRFVFLIWTVISLWPLIFLGWDSIWYWIYLYLLLAILIVMTYKRMKALKDTLDDHKRGAT